MSKWDGTTKIRLHQQQQDTIEVDGSTVGGVFRETLNRARKADLEQMRQRTARERAQLDASFQNEMRQRRDDPAMSYWLTDESIARLRRMADGSMRARSAFDESFGDVERTVGGSPDKIVFDELHEAHKVEEQRLAAQRLRAAIKVDESLQGVTSTWADADADPAQDIRDYLRRTRGNG